MSSFELQAYKVSFSHCTFILRSEEPQSAKIYLPYFEYFLDRVSFLLNNYRECYLSMPVELSVYSHASTFFSLNIYTYISRFTCLMYILISVPRCRYR